MGQHCDGWAIERSEFGQPYNCKKCLGGIGQDFRQILGDTVALVPAIPCDLPHAGKEPEITLKKSASRRLL